MNTPKDVDEHPWQHLWRSTVDAATGVTGSSQSLSQELGQWPHQWVEHSLQATQTWWAWWFQYFNPTQLPWRQPGLTELQAEMAQHLHDAAPGPASASSKATAHRSKPVAAAHNGDLRPKAHAGAERHR